MSFVSNCVDIVSNWRSVERHAGEPSARKASSSSNTATIVGIACACAVISKFSSRLPHPSYTSNPTPILPHPNPTPLTPQSYPNPTPPLPPILPHPTKFVKKTAINLNSLSVIRKIYSLYLRCFAILWFYFILTISFSLVAILIAALVIMFRRYRSTSMYNKFDSQVQYNNENTSHNVDGEGNFTK